MIEGALITGGVMISYWLDFGFSFLEPSSISWRFPIAFQIVFALIILTFVLGLPESPRWLIKKGKEQEAIVVLCALGEKNPDDREIQAEFQAIKDTVLIMEQGSFRDLFTMDEDRNFHRVVLAYVNQMFQQVSLGMPWINKTPLTIKSDQWNQPNYLLPTDRAREQCRSQLLPRSSHRCMQWYRVFHGLLDCRIHD